jgi:mRNA interferase MazF
MMNSGELSNRNPRRGDILRARLNPIEGSEQVGERPVLVLSPDLINEHSTVILVAALTSRKTDRLYPFEALLEPPEGGLTERSKVLLLHVRSIDKRRITGRYGRVSDAVMSRVDEALKIAVGLAEI